MKRLIIALRVIVDLACIGFGPSMAFYAATLETAQLAKPQPPGLIAFMKATGYPNGRPGFVVDHRLPVCAGGDPNDANNLQWQEKAASYRKDVCERALCREMKRQGYRLVKVEQK